MATPPTFCVGLQDRVVTYRDEERFDVEPMLARRSGKNFHIRHDEKWTSVDGTEMTGTIRSAKCIMSKPSLPYSCADCKHLPHEASFNQAVRQKQPDSPHKNTPVSHMTEIQRLQNEIKGLRRRLRIAQCKPRKDSLAYVARRVWRRNRCAFVHIKNMLANVVRKPKGHRFDPKTRAFWVVLLAKAGPKLTTFVSSNFCGPSTTTIRGWSGDDKFGGEDLEQTVIYVAEIYTKS